MRDAAGIANYFFRAASGAGNSRRGMDSAKASSSTLETPPLSETILSNTPNGDVTSATVDATILACSGADERMFLARMRRMRSEGWMPSMPEFDLLLELAERRTQT